MISAVLFILFTHWVADFVFQNDTMAVNKSKSLYWLSMHVLTYMAVTVGMIVVAVLLVTGFHFDSDAIPFYAKIVAWVVINGALHWLTDYFTSRATTWLWINNQRHYFFVMIGLDQIIHYACLLITYQKLFLN
jgi:membrane-bound metal-dependent hydrolase YbcI (DUF457 family)